jgi:hypothetical protein
MRKATPEEINILITRDPASPHPVTATLAVNRGIWYHVDPKDGLPGNFWEQQTALKEDGLFFGMDIRTEQIPGNPAGGFYAIAS